MDPISKYVILSSIAILVLGTSVFVFAMFMSRLRSIEDEMRHPPVRPSPMPPAAVKPR